MPGGLFALRLKKYVSRIVTDSTPPGVPKDPEASTIFQLDRVRRAIGIAR